MFGNNPFSSAPISSYEININGTFSATLDSISVNIGATVYTPINLTATMAVTLDSLSVSAAAVLGHAGSMSVTLDSIQVSATGTLGHTANMAVTLESIDVNMSETLGHTASMAVTLQSISTDINALVSSPGAITGTLAATLDSIGVSMFAAETPIFVVDTHDGEGLKKKFQKEAQDKAKYRKRVIDLYEELVELKPKAAEEIIAPFADENAQKQSGLDFNALLGNLDRTEALYNSLKRELEEIDDEEVFLLL
jgi:hypothetical protein